MEEKEVIEEEKVIVKGERGGRRMWESVSFLLRWTLQSS